MYYAESVADKAKKKRKLGGIYLRYNTLFSI